MFTTVFFWENTKKFKKQYFKMFFDLFFKISVEKRIKTIDHEIEI